MYDEMLLYNANINILNWHGCIYVGRGSKNYTQWDLSNAKQL